MHISIFILFKRHIHIFQTFNSNIDISAISIFRGCPLLACDLLPLFPQGNGFLSTKRILIWYQDRHRLVDMFRRTLLLTVILPTTRGFIERTTKGRQFLRLQPMDGLYINMIVSWFLIDFL